MGVLPYSKPNGKKLYFDRNKLEEWMMSGSSVSNAKEIAETYVKIY
jgi:hypothetical protein